MKVRTVLLLCVLALVLPGYGRWHRANLYRIDPALAGVDAAVAAQCSAKIDSDAVATLTTGSGSYAGDLIVNLSPEARYHVDMARRAKMDRIPYQVWPDIHSPYRRLYLYGQAITECKWSGCHALHTREVMKVHVAQKHCRRRSVYEVASASFITMAGWCSHPIATFDGAMERFAGWPGFRYVLSLCVWAVAFCVLSQGEMLGRTRYQNSLKSYKQRWQQAASKFPDGDSATTAENLNAPFSLYGYLIDWAIGRGIIALIVIPPVLRILRL